MQDWKRKCDREQSSSTCKQATVVFCSKNLLSAWLQRGTEETVPGCFCFPDFPGLELCPGALCLLEQSHFLPGVQKQLLQRPIQETGLEVMPGDLSLSLSSSRSRKFIKCVKIAIKVSQHDVYFLQMSPDRYSC